MIKPGIQRIRLRDGRVVVLRTDVVCEIEKSAALRLEKAAESYKKNRPKYFSLGRYRPKQIIAAVLLEFGASQFTREDVRKWCAFAGEDFTLEEISNALSQLQSSTEEPIHLLTGRGREACWEVNGTALEEFLQR